MPNFADAASASCKNENIQISKRAAAKERDIPSVLLAVSVCIEDSYSYRQLALACGFLTPNSGRKKDAVQIGI